MIKFCPNTYTLALFDVPFKEILLPVSIVFWICQHSWQVETHKFWITLLGNETTYSKTRFTWNMILYLWCANLEASLWPKSTLIYRPSPVTCALMVLLWVIRSVALLVLLYILLVPASPYSIRVQRYYRQQTEELIDNNRANDTGSRAFSLSRVSCHP